MRRIRSYLTAWSYMILIKDVFKVVWGMLTGLKNNQKGSIIRHLF
jgi:hypothetical protein